jgi:hypothetical protein
MKKSTAKLFGSKVFKTKNANAVLFFACPFGHKIWKFRPVIKRLQRAGYTVVAYDIHTDVFYTGQPENLIKVVGLIKKDMKARISEFQELGIKDFGFFGSSLGSFIMYSCLNDVKELRWGVLNTGGNIARGMWRIKKPKEIFEAKGWTEAKLDHAWRVLYPKFEGLEGHKYFFVSSHDDEIVPLGEIDECVAPIRRGGAQAEIRELSASSHASTVVKGLRIARKLVAEVRQL